MLQAHADEDDASTQTKDTQKLAATWSGKILWMIQKKFTGKGDEKHDQGSWN